MICSHVQKKVAEYLQGALGPDDRRALECHMSGCEECAGKLFERTYVSGGRVRLRETPNSSERAQEEMTA